VLGRQNSLHWLRK